MYAQDMYTLMIRISFNSETCVCEKTLKYPEIHWSFLGKSNTVIIGDCGLKQVKQEANGSKYLPEKHLLAKTI